MSSLYDKDYIATWRPNRGSHLTASVVRVLAPPHEEPKGTILEELVVDALADHHSVEADAIEVLSVVELPNATWCHGQTREVVVAGRAASLEAGHNGWRIHI